MGRYREGYIPWNKGTKGVVKSWNKGNIGYRKGHIVSEETRKKMSIAQKGKKRSEEVKRQMSIDRTGRVTSEETKKKLRDAFKGEKSHLWRGGLTNPNHTIRTGLDMQLRRKSCFGRDNFTCQKCSQYGGDLECHHINNFADFPELRFIVENGVTLCKTCHKKFHVMFGKRNNSKEQLYIFLDT